MQKFLESLIALLFPPRCSICRRLVIRETLICPSCMGDIGRLELSYGAAFPQGVSFYRYEGAIQKALHCLKFKPQSLLVAPLACVWVDKIRRSHSALPGIDGIIPVPLAPKRLRTRGFNQSALFAKAISDAFGIPLYPDVLIRIRETRPQFELSKAERLTNIAGAFGISKPLPMGCETIWLVDDIYTTGATMRECATALRQSGAKKIVSLTLARA